MKITGLFLLIAVFFLGCSSGGDEIQHEDPMPNTAPSVPLLTYPTNELLCTEFELDFAWQAASDADGDPISYTLQIASDQQFNNIIGEKTVLGTSELVLLEKGETFYWRVRANDDQSNSSQFTAPWKFYTIAEAVENHLPYLPELLQPLMGATVSGNTTVLSWEVGDIDDDILSYDLYFGLTADPPLFQEDLDTNSYEASLEPDNTYYWKIVAYDGQGGVSIGPVWEFGSE